MDIAAERIVVNRNSAALLLVDLQPDFMPRGALAVTDGDAVLGPVLDTLARGLFDLVIATQDWHPHGHVSFASSHAEARPFDAITLYGHPQVLWPDHCVQDTPGAALHACVPQAPLAAIVRKGMDPRVDSYSAFRNNHGPAGDRPTTGLAGLLRERGVTHVVLAGLARDYCVLWSAEDAAEAGFDTTVLWDATRPVDPSSDARVRAKLEDRGIHVTLASLIV